MNRATLILAAVLGAGCATYEAKPLDPAVAAAEFSQRALSDEGLRAFLEGQRGAPAIAWPPAAWDLPLLTRAAFYYHPDLDVARARVAVAEAQVVTAGALPNPTLSTPLLEYVTNPAAGVSPWVLGMSLDLPIEISGKRGCRIEQAEHLAAAARLELAETGWKVRSRLRAALLDHLLSLREAELLRAEHALRAEAVRLVERRRAVGEVSQPDVDESHAELSASAIALQAAEGRVPATRAELAAAVGVPVRALEGVRLAWPALDGAGVPALSDADAQRAALLNRLDLLRSLSEYAAAEAALKLEVARQYPDINVGPGYLYDQRDNKFTLGLSVELPVFNRNEGPLAEAKARREEAGAGFLALQARIIGETEAAVARLRAAREGLAGAETLLGLLEARERSARRAVEAGEEDRLALAGVRVRRASAARDRLEAARKIQEALGALEDAVQQPLDGSAAIPEVPSASPRVKPAKEGE